MSEKNENDIHYNASEMINNGNKPYVIGNELNKEKKEYIVGKSVESTIQTGKYAGGVFGVNTGINATIQAAKLTAKATQLTTQAAQYSTQVAQYTAKAAQMAKEANNYSKFLNFFTGTGAALSKEAANISAQASNYASQATNLVSKAASAEAAAAESTTIGLVGKYAGVGLLGLGIIVGVSCGAYFTHKFCEEYLDKFVEYYKNNSHKIKNSYEEAANYFLNN